MRLIPPIMSDLQSFFKQKASQYLVSGQKLRIASDINGTLLGTAENQTLGDKEMPINVRLLKFLILAKLAGHDVAVFSNDPDGNARTFKMYESRIFSQVFDELELVEEQRESALRDLFGKQENGSYFINHKNIRDDVSGFEAGCDLVFEDEDAGWAGSSALILSPGTDFEKAFLEDILNAPKKLTLVQTTDYLPLPWPEHVL